MNITCTVCKQLDLVAPQTRYVMINPSDYTCTATLSNIATIEVLLPPRDLSTDTQKVDVTITITNNMTIITYSYKIKVTVVNGLAIGVVDSKSAGLNLTFPDGQNGFQTGTTKPNAFINQIVLGSDTYLINLVSNCTGFDSSVAIKLISQLQLSVYFNTDSLKVDNEISTIALCPCNCLTSCTTCKNYKLCECKYRTYSHSSSCHNAGVDSTCSSVKIPTLQILAQTTINGGDIGEVDFLIRDTIDYTRENIRDNTCQARFVKPNQVISSCFQECCPFIVSVLKGEGCTAYQKVMNLYVTLSIVDITFNQFYKRIMAYAMLKFILFRLLTGKFKICYLLDKYNKRFLEQLSTSRFCNATQFFLDCESEIYGYNKYFLVDCKK